MNFKTTLVLVLLLVAGGIFFFVAKDDPTPDPIAQREAAARGEALWPAGTDREQIRRIVLERDGKTLELSREGQDWWQVQPVRVKLNRWSISSLVDALADLAAIETLTPGRRDAPSLEDAGLTHPTAQVQAFTAEATEPTLAVRIGRRLSGHSLIQVEGQPTIRVVGNALRDAVTADPNGWRNRSLEAPSAAEASAAIARAGDYEISLQKTDGRWYLDAAGTRRASREDADKLVQVVRNLSISGFAADAPAHLSTYGLDEPIATLQITRSAAQDDTDAEEGTLPAPTAPAGVLKVGSPTELEGDQHFATWSTDPDAPVVVFTVSRTSLAALLDLDPQKLQEKKLFAMPADEVVRLAIEQPGQPALVLERGVGSTLNFGVPTPGFALDTTAGSNLLRSVAEAEALAFVSGQALTDLQAGDPVATVQLTRRGEEQARTARFYETEHEGAPALTAVVTGETLGYVLPAELLAPARTPQAALRDRRVLEFRKLAPVAFQVRNAEGLAAFVARPAAEEGGQPDWQLADGRSINSNALEELLVELENLQVYRWLTGPVESGSDTLELSLTPGGEGAEPIVLRVDPTTRRATLSGEVQGFELSQAAVAVLQQTFVAPATAVTAEEADALPTAD